MSIEINVSSEDEFGDLVKLIARMEQRIPVEGRQIVQQAAGQMHQAVLRNLETQGRGGQGPPLSEATRLIYSTKGDPDGSGIRNHLSVDYQQQGNRFVAVLGLPSGEPTMVAIVQDRGAVIPVTDAMRGYLAHTGIHLRRETTHIHVPGRRFWQSAWRDVERTTKRRLKRLFKDIKRGV